MDGGLGVAEYFFEAICNSHFVQETLRKSGFVVNCEKLFGSRRKLIYFGTNIKGFTFQYTLLPFRYQRNNILEKKNIQTLKKRPFIPYKWPITKVYSDASNSRIGTSFEIKGEKCFIHKKFSSTEKWRSSTWRELEAIYYSLCSLPQFLENWKQYITPCVHSRNFYIIIHYLAHWQLRSQQNCKIRY